MSRGTSGHAGTGALARVVSLGLFGLILGLAATAADEDLVIGDARKTAVLSAGVGAGLGAIVGSAFRDELWEEIPLRQGGAVPISAE